MTKRTQQKPREFQNYSTRDAIRVAAEKICGEVGATNVKLREIARRVGIKPASIYSYYSGLDDILAAVIEYALDELAVRLQGVEGDSLESTVRSLSLIKTRFYTEKKGVSRLLLIDLASVDGNAAFNANIDLIVLLNRREMELIGRHVDLTELSKAERNDIVIARLGMTLTMLAVRWLQHKEVGEDEIGYIAQVAADHVLGHVGRLPARR